VKKKRRREKKEDQGTCLFFSFWTLMTMREKEKALKKKKKEKEKTKRQEVFEVLRSSLEWFQPLMSLEFWTFCPSKESKSLWECSLKVQHSWNPQEK